MDDSVVVGDAESPWVGAPLGHPWGAPVVLPDDRNVPDALDMAAFLDASVVVPAFLAVGEDHR